MAIEASVISREPTRIQSDSLPVVLAAVSLVGILAVVSFALGVPRLVDVAEWAGLPRLLRWGVPLMVDGGLVVFALVATVRRARQESARFAWTCLAALTLASMSIQIAHVASSTGGGRQQVVGMVLAAAFPAVVFASTHSLIDLAVAPSPMKNRRFGTSSVRWSKVAQNSNTERVTTSSIKASTVSTTKAEGPEKSSEDRDIQRKRVTELRVNGISFAKIASEIGVPVSTVKRWVSAEVSR